MSESAFLKRLLKSAAAHGVWLFRNNVGLFYTRDGRPVATGLPRGFSDTTGWTEVTIRLEDVGRKVAVYTAYETKSTTGRATVEQLRFIDAVRRSGGIADVMREGQDINQRLSSAVTEWRERNG